MHDSRVVTGRQPCGPGAVGEREQLGEPEAAVARDARVRRLAARVAADERRHDRAAELLAKIERHVRQPEPVARLAGRDHGARRAARALAVGACRIHPQPQCHPERVRARAQQGDRAVDAAAHRDGDALGVRGRVKDLTQGICQRIDRQRLAWNRRGLEQRQPFERPLEPGRVGSDDAIAVERQANERELRAAR